MWDQLLTGIIQGNVKSLARAISLVENEVSGFETFLQQLPAGHTPVTGITGPPGAGKSTLVDAMIATWVAAGKKVAVLCVDPSSPFNLGALLGDRIRMSEWYNNPNVFIRSLANRGSLGGLHPHIIEITAILQAGGFDHIIVETVGVGQSEIEIAGLADVTVVVVVPEAGDEVQTMKAGLMEIADIFVVNKSDRPEADTFVKNLRQMLAPAFNSQKNISVVKTVASARKGVDELCKLVDDHVQLAGVSERKHWLMTERVFQLIQKNKMKGIEKASLKQAIAKESANPGFNLFTFAQQYLNESTK
ncbi:MAG: methylmalonyl Co-A mutase-associated GTPase MeaB [Sediminibacterium sp.]|nr:methylmalonyl Co-A mutase-associated GTPase MeaB [Sediminibacterium sp.]